jgi:6-pyruvoyltetrahydropterin/6-carboxytetrahydropterin synthase
MVIRKLFRFEGAHIVRNCSSVRCKESIHGHSYTVEVFFKSMELDNGEMVVDFGLMKGTIKDLIDSFDHAYSMWDKEDDEFKQFIYDHSARWISMPVSPSAESYSFMLLKIIDKMVRATEFNNGESGVKVDAVRVHETATGYAEASQEDLEYWKSIPITEKKRHWDLEDVVFSNAIKEEWKDPEMYDKLIAYSCDTSLPKPFINPVVKQQV